VAGCGTATHSNDPDDGALLRISNKSRDAYLRWGRNCLGWAMYLFRRPGGWVARWLRRSCTYPSFSSPL